MSIFFCILFVRFSSFCCKVKYQFIHENVFFFLDEFTQLISVFFVVVFSYSVHADIKCICVWTRSVKSVPAVDIHLAFHLCYMQKLKLFMNFFVFFE